MLQDVCLPGSKILTSVGVSGMVCHQPTYFSNYFFKSFGIVFVVDASDTDRLEECKKALQETEMQPRVAGKPLLM